MTTSNEWELLVTGASEQALETFRANYDRSGDRSALANSGVALLDLRRYSEAIEAFEEVRRGELRDGIGSELTLVDLGVARWCGGDRSGAILDWETSLLAKYTDEAGGVQGPAMLWFGAVKTGDGARQQRAVRLLRRFWKPRLSGLPNWPGPSAIAGFVLGEVNEQCFIQKWAQDHPVLEARRRCKALFWAGVKQEDRFLAKHRFHLAFGDRTAILEPEFFLARWALDVDHSPE